jgi:hypothetical protein
MKPLIIVFGIRDKKPHFYIGFKKQWDMEKQPLFALFRCKMVKDSGTRTDRIFTLGGKI